MSEGVIFPSRADRFPRYLCPFQPYDGTLNFDNLTSFFSIIFDIIINRHHITARSGSVLISKNQPQNETEGHSRVTR